MPIGKPDVEKAGASAKRAHRAACAPWHGSSRKIAKLQQPRLENRPAKSTSRSIFLFGRVVRRIMGE
jgi:hypothetical protein